jgi:hypothetical protein
MKLDRLDIRSSATVGGAVTNRVEVRRRAPKRGPAWRQDPDRPKGHTQVCISLAPEELARIDQVAAELGLSRSRMLVLAALGSHLTPDEARLVALVRRMRR